MPFDVPARPSGSVRVATLNLCGDPVDLTARYDALLDWVWALDPDVLAVQEAAPDTTATWLPRLAADGPLSHLHHPPGTAAAVLARAPLKATGVLTVPNAHHPIPHLGLLPWATTTTPAGRDLLVVSAHLAWGPTAEAVRGAQAGEVETWAAAHVGPVVDHHLAPVVLAGDFNAEPDHAVLRYLRGQQTLPGSATSTVWTDAWADAQIRHGDPHGTTSTPRNVYALRTATVHRRGITDPTLLPDRRIDYLMVRGFRHGSPGTPLAAGLWAGPAGTHPLPVSDHYGVWSDLSDPG